MSWKLPLNQIGNGSTFLLGPVAQQPKFRATQLNISQHPWLAEILSELNCSSEGPDANFSMALDVEKQSETFRVTAKVTMIPKLECVRSLTPFRTAIESENEALYVRGQAQPTGGEHELSESEMEAYEHDGQGLMLSEFVTDVIFTSLPDFPLCRTDCRGLCTECGCNLNEAKNCGNKTTSQEPDFECPHAAYFQ